MLYKQNQMKIRILVALTMIIANFGFSQNTDSDDDCSGVAKYYAISKVYILESMNTNSAIIAEVPAGEQIVTVSTFFGDHGWWKICYKGSIGHARKNLFSETNVSSEPTSPTVSNIDNQEVGFTPFLARATTTLNFRSGPSSSSTKIKSIWVGSTVFVYSNNPVNNYYKAIDVMTGQVGWAHKNFIKHFQDVVVNIEGAFLSTGYTASQYPEILIKNNSSHTTKLVVGTETISLSPNSTKSIKVKPGRKYYIAITPGVIPIAGYQLFESNNEYEWNFR